MRTAAMSVLSHQPTTSSSMLAASPSLFSRTTILLLRPGVASVRHRSPARLYCNSSMRVPPHYADGFATRMSMAALQPHHRIAMGVSGGADSMALCALMANWKTCSNDGGALDSSGFINGLLAIIVDHGLRSESKEEAQTVSRWVSDMGIRCEVACCDWPDGLPKAGRLEEEARDMRYQIFQDVCFHNQIGVLLTAHHADDQAELFVIRLSRNSGVLGLAGMAFTTQLFPKFPNVACEPLNNVGIQLIRPLLQFTKEDLYKLNKSSNQNWVEDPTNTSSLFARNRIRMSLKGIQTCSFRSELQALIAVCRCTRLYVDHTCQILLKEAVRVMPHGYTVIDMGSLSSSTTEEIVHTRFLALILQFVSQRHRPVRGSALKLFLEYIRSFPCKTSFTAAGCYICPAPGSKGTKVLVCCSADSALPINSDLYHVYNDKELKPYIPADAHQIIKEQTSLSDNLVPDCSEVRFLDTVASDSILEESQRSKILSKSTCELIAELQIREKRLFKSKQEDLSSCEPRVTVDGAIASRKPFRPGQSCYFMNRFFLSWRCTHESGSANLDETERSLQHYCSLCTAGDKQAYIRHMIDEDWIYLAKLSQTHDSAELQQQKVLLSNGMEQATYKTNLCFNHASLSAQVALKTLKPIPAAARRGMPVVVSVEGIILSIPSVGFNVCPSLMISAEFRPRVPLGGGQSLFI